MKKKAREVKKVKKLPSIKVLEVVTQKTPLYVPLEGLTKSESRFDLYKRLKEAQYPQGGGGAYMQDPDSSEKVYIPTHQELIMHYVSDPSGWEKLTDALTRVWIENNK